MQAVQTHNIQLTDSMEFNVAEMKAKLTNHFGKELEPHFLIEKDANEFVVKIMAHFWKKDFIAKANNMDFLQALTDAEKKLNRLLTDAKEQIKGR